MLRTTVRNKDERLLLKCAEWNSLALGQRMHTRYSQHHCLVEEPLGVELWRCSDRAHKRGIQPALTKVQSQIRRLLLREGEPDLGPPCPEFVENGRQFWIERSSFSYTDSYVASFAAGDLLRPETSVIKPTQDGLRLFMEKLTCFGQGDTTACALE